jgi:hypothetical protein
MTKKISAERFALFSIGTRQAFILHIVEELSYWSDLDETIIGLVARDKIDHDYSWVLLARDRLGRFRAVDQWASLASERIATAQLRIRIGELTRAPNLEELGIQGDETNAPIDLLTPLPGSKDTDLHPYFKALLETPGRQPARSVFKELGPWLTATDPHFVQEFQRHQFDQRLWELYLWASLRELGYDVTHGEAPDFIVEAPDVQFCVEATTVAPTTAGALSKHPNPQTAEERREFLRGYMPIKYGSSLTAKLNRRSAEGLAYWEEPNASGLPFVIAVADFHKPASENELGSMVFTQSAIWAYLYGIDFDWSFVEGELIVEQVPLKSHEYNGKSIESGFFGLPDSENIAAVLFSNAGTLAKFDRMGVCAGFGAEGHAYIRTGYRTDPDPNAEVGIGFVEIVGSETYSEGWADELQVFHNPHANIPLPFECFGPLTQHRIVAGKLVTTSGFCSVITSFTTIIGPNAQAQS